MTPATPDIPAAEIAIVEMTNAFRAENKLADVRPNGQLQAAARAFAAFLAKSGEFSHTADGHQPGDRVTGAGYQWCQVGENLALHVDSRGFESRDLARKSVEGWINSPAHRENMLAPHVTEIGVAIAKAADKDPKYISVEVFARPRSLQYEFQISNTSTESVSYSFGGETHEVAPSFAVTHTACSPGTLSFDRIGRESRARSISARYEASDGLVYTLKSDQASGLKVEIVPFEKAK
ncbi:MAG TPA: CAP domain-containing protein [Hyphomicrobiaceae bacterium]|nr:CAP domain-containing protein [Hyphomicrobiaceae bacterium]